MRGKSPATTSSILKKTASKPANVNAENVAIVAIQDGVDLMARVRREIMSADIMIPENRIGEGRGRKMRGGGRICMTMMVQRPHHDAVVRRRGGG